MTFGTFLTLFVLPTAYTLLARDRARTEADGELAVDLPKTTGQA
jgi:hypothetical protein